MDFGLSAEQEELRDRARELLAQECAPSRVRAAMATENAHDAALWKTFAEAGWLGVLIPESHGGAGLALLDAMVIAGELGRTLAPGPFLASSVAAVVALREGGSAAQQRSWLPRIAAGDAVVTIALAEPPEPRVDAAGVTLRAKGSGKRLRLDGTKLPVESAGSADALLVACRSAAASGRRVDTERFDGVSLALLPADTAGLSHTPLISVDETRRNFETRLRGVTVDRDTLLPRSPRALRRALDAWTITLAAESLGGAERALEDAVAYVKQRHQFGRPVGSFQAVQHLAAECVAEIEPARSLVWVAAWAFDSRPREATLAAARASARCGDVFRRVTRTATEMMGGIGFTLENDLQLWFKRALANAAALGDPTLQRERVLRLRGI